MKYLQEVKKAFSEVYKIKKYYLVTLFSLLLLLLSNPLAINYKLIMDNLSIKLMVNLFIGYLLNLSFIHLILVITLSLLAGIVTSFSIFIIRRQISTNFSGSITGIITAIIAPACPSCALGIFSVLGLGGLLTFLPFKGLEIGLISLIILIITLVYLAKKINTKSCKIK